MAMHGMRSVVIIALVAISLAPQFAWAQGFYNPRQAPGFPVYHWRQPPGFPVYQNWPRPFLWSDRREERGEDWRNRHEGRRGFERFE
jgi:hypothetical protein